MHGRKQEVDLVDKIPEDGECVRHPEKDHMVAKIAAKLPPETTPRIIKRRSRTERAKLTGHTARRMSDGSERVIWDTEYPGFGLRFRASGRKTWVVSFRQRKVRRTVTLGSVSKMSVRQARREARRILSEAQLDGLPTKAKTRMKSAPLFSDYAEEFWADYARHWKPTTETRNQSALKLYLLPYFGEMAVDTIQKTDIARFRDGLSARPQIFNRAIPVLSVMMKYAEQLGYRRIDSNPCRGTPRYKTQLKERYLTPTEYRRLATSLNALKDRFPGSVTIIWLLIYTGARFAEIQTLRWEYVKPPRLMLPDSKTGPKTIYLNTQARAMLDAIPGKKQSGLLFPSPTIPDKPISIVNSWPVIRHHAAIPDVRLHDLRHSFASLAIRDGISLLVIGKLLGHALPETTARYAHLADETIQDSASRVCLSIASAMGGSR